MTARRRQFRMPVSRCGLVTRDRTTTLCEILDITDQGLHFSTDLLLSENDTVRIECQLEADCIMQCGLVITHAEPASLRRANDTPAPGTPATAGVVHTTLDHFQYGGVVTMLSSPSDPAQAKDFSSQTLIDFAPRRGDTFDR